MTNKYLSKIAAKTEIDASGTGLDNVHKAPRVTLKEPIKPLPTLAKEAGVIQGAKDFYKSLHATDKVKLGLSGTGLALGTAGFISAQHQRAKDERRHNLEAQSLTTLKKIHEALAAKDKPV